MSIDPKKKKPLKRKSRPKKERKGLRLIEEYMAEISVYDEETPDGKSIIRHRHENRLTGKPKKP